MPLRERDQEVQALAPYRANESFAMRIGLGLLVWRSQHRQPKSLCQFMVELSGEDRVPIMNEKPVSLLAWDRFPKLLRGPFCRGVGKLAEAVLVAGGLAVVVVFVVEPRAGQGHVAGVRMQTFAAAQLGSQCLDQASAAQNAREGVIALGAVEFEAEFAGQINPDRHFFLFSRRGVGFGQALDNLPPDEMTEA